MFSCRAVQQVSCQGCKLRLQIKHSLLPLPAVLHTANQQGQEEQVAGQQKVLQLSPNNSQSNLDSMQRCLQYMHRQQQAQVMQHHLETCS